MYTTTSHLFSHPSRYMYSRNFFATAHFNARSSNFMLAILLPSPLSDSSVSQYIIWFGVVGVGQHWWTCEGSMYIIKGRLALSPLTYTAFLLPLPLDLGHQLIE